MCSYLNMTFLWALLAAALDPAKYAFSVAYTARPAPARCTHAPLAGDRGRQAS